jgi:aspartyl-tRNA(Asn)/glutamyl-tRNA(Gln) amidotransferase subunit C
LDETLELIMVDKQTVERVSKLARIAVNESEKEYLSSQLSQILDYIDQLKKVDVEQVAPMRGLHLESGLLRQDEPRDSQAQTNILANAPAKESGCFKVPKVIE